MYIYQALTSQLSEYIADKYPEISFQKLQFFFMKLQQIDRVNQGLLKIQFRIMCYFFFIMRRIWLLIVIRKG